jgi:large conductance mechanosensitive channel
MSKIVDEFREFAVKGNAVDLAIGVVIGAAFGAIVSSFVKDIINPLIGLLTGGIDFSDKVIVLKAATDMAEAVTINYGVFINSVINFLIVAWAIFFVVRSMNKIQRTQEETDKKKRKEDSVPKPSQEVQILEEIRDTLKNKK